MKIKIGYAVIMLLLGTIFFSCKSKTDKIEAVVSKWIGREIQFPSDVPCSIYGEEFATDSTTRKLLTSEYKVLLYIDSTGCMSCRLEDLLYGFRQLTENADSAIISKTGFVLWFHPKNEKELTRFLKGKKFDYPVFIDLHNKIDKLNNLPEKFNYQCFLLNKTNKVVAIGNPIIYPRIWDLYRKNILKN